MLTYIYGEGPERVVEVACLTTKSGFCLLPTDSSPGPFARALLPLPSPMLNHGGHGFWWNKLEKRLYVERQLSCCFLCFRPSIYSYTRAHWSFWTTKATLSPSGLSAILLWRRWTPWMPWKVTSIMDTRLNFGTILCSHQPTHQFAFQGTLSWNGRKPQCKGWPRENLNTLIHWSADI